MKRFYVALVVMFVVFMGYNVYTSGTNKKMSALTLANIEALAQSESNDLKIGCDSYSVVIKCQSMCTSCYRIWTTATGYGNSTGLKGKCACGRYYY